MSQASLSDVNLSGFGNSTSSNITLINGEYLLDSGGNGGGGGGK
jgi:hypothetical protein